MGYNTPETTRSGFLDGMVLATATGRCCKRLAASLPGFSPLPDDHVIHIGGRDFDPEERDLLDRSGVALVTWEKIQAMGLTAALQPALLSLSERVRQVYVHVDQDTLDPQAAPANQFLPHGGLSVTQVEAALMMVRSLFELRGAGLAFYDPSYDPEGLGLEDGLRFMEKLVEPG